MAFGWQAAVLNEHYLEPGKENCVCRCLEGTPKKYPTPSQEKKEREQRENYNQHTQYNINSFPKLLMSCDLSNIKTKFGKPMKEKEIQTKQAKE